jgi:selenocysteine lyase/cysteine desulfurase
MQRRKFLQAAAKGALVAGSTALVWKHSNSKPLPLLPPKDRPIDELVQDEEYWSGIRQFFEIPTEFINLENGYFSPQPISTIYQHQKRESYINHRTSHFMRREQEQSIETARTALADFLGCDAEELALTRNTTESLNTLIAGYPWKKGDEVVIGNQDYGSMVAAFQQAAVRWKIKIKVAQIPLLPKDDAEIIEAFSRHFTKKTRLVHITHLVNLTGQVLPVNKIADIAHSKGIEIAVDAAHSVAHISYKINELHADYVGASLHKWLCNPLGAGFLWMRKAHIPKIIPLMADSDQPVSNIRKFEHQGTRPVQTLETISTAIAFHEQIGSELKEKRLKYLMQSWCSALHDKPAFTMLTPWKWNSRNSAIACVSKKGFTPDQLAGTILERHKIFTVAINHPIVNGIRVTPHIYTLKSDVDAFARAMQAI